LYIANCTLIIVYMCFLDSACNNNTFNVLNLPELFGKDKTGHWKVQLEIFVRHTGKKNSFTLQKIKQHIFYISL